MIFHEPQQLQGIYRQPESNQWFLLELFTLFPSLELDKFSKVAYQKCWGDHGQAWIFHSTVLKQKKTALFTWLTLYIGKFIVLGNLVA